MGRVIALRETLSVYWTNECSSYEDYVEDPEEESWRSCTLMSVRGRKEGVDIEFVGLIMVDRHQVDGLCD
jgi:hypothetical protein